MTYCLSLLCREGIVCLSDSRTSAGVDNINIQPKLRVYEEPGKRILCLMTSGNLSLTQTLISLIEEDMLKGKNDPELHHLLSQPTVYEAARYVGMKIREVDRLDREALESNGFRFNINVLVSGQIAGLEHQIFLVYPQGNSIHASIESPFLQIGEFKYGKPVLDRGFTYETPLTEAVKFGVLSLETTMKSNVSVGTPFDIFCYERDSFVSKFRMRLEEDDPYLVEIRGQWQQGIVDLVARMPGIVFPGSVGAPGGKAAEIA